MSDCPCCLPPWELGIESAEGDTPWNGVSKFYLYVGTVTTTIATSQLFTQAGATRGHSYDGTDTYITDRITTPSVTQWLRRYSGQFTSTVKDSLDVASVAVQVYGSSWAGDSIYWIDETGGTERFMETSGKFTSTLRQSVSIDTKRHEGITHGTVNTYSMYEPFASGNGKFLTYSGKFTSTLKTSVTLTSMSCEYDLTFDGVRAIAGVDYTADAGGTISVYLGFTSTVIDSAGFYGVDTLFGVNSNNSLTG